MNENACNDGSKRPSRSGARWLASVWYPQQEGAGQAYLWRGMQLGLQVTGVQALGFGVQVCCVAPGIARTPNMGFETRRNTRIRSKFCRPFKPCISVDLLFTYAGNIQS